MSGDIIFFSGAAESLTKNGLNEKGLLRWTFGSVAPLKKDYESGPVFLPQAEGADRGSPEPQRVRAKVTH